MFCHIKEGSGVTFGGSHNFYELNSFLVENCGKFYHEITLLLTYKYVFIQLADPGGRTV
jgi:hypothetical protein